MSTLAPRRRRRPGLTRLPSRALVLATAVLACTREPDLDEVFPPPRPLAKADSPRAGASRFALVAPGETRFTVGPRVGRTEGRVDLASGELDIDSFDLASTRGHATFDLATVQVVETAADDSKRASRWDKYLTGSLTERARQWLEAADPAQPQHRFARFSITSVGDLSAQAAVDGVRTSGAAGTISRRVSLRATGELELHGTRFPYTAALDARFEWTEPMAPGSAPRRVEITTREPIVVDLTTHGILPRTATGDLHAEALAELRKSSGHQARVTARWVASAAGSLDSLPATASGTERE